MSRFKSKGKSKGAQEIPTTALPDIIFILLFFFMVVTTVKPSNRLVENVLPKARNISEVEQKNAMVLVYIGAPADDSQGEEPRVQIGDRFVDPSEIRQIVSKEKEQLGDLAELLTIVLKIDRDAPMGIVNDVEVQLREIDQRKILYVSALGDPVE